MEQGDDELFSNGYRSFIWDDEKVLDVDGCDNYKTLGMYLILLHCTPKNH